ISMSLRFCSPDRWRRLTMSPAPMIPILILRFLLAMPFECEATFDHMLLDLFNFEDSVDLLHERRTLRALFPVMSRVCSITGSRVTRGSIIHRRGMAKKKGGVGRHVTKNVRREFHPNLHEHRIWVPELRKFVRIRVTARGLKTINKNGAYQALKKAGIIAG